MITVDHLTKRYDTVTAVDDLSFEVGPGRVTGFLGPNGAGKTTALRILLGLAARTAAPPPLTGSLTATCPIRRAASGRRWRMTASTRAAAPSSTCGSWPPRPGSAAAGSPRCWA